MSSDSNLAPSGFVLFLHGCGDPTQARVHPDMRLEEVLRAAGLEVGEGFVVMTNEAGPGDDAVARELHVGSTVAAAGLGHHSHIVCSPCAAISVSVFYQHHTATGEFSPTTTVGAVERWAERRFGLADASERYELVAEGDPSPLRDTIRLVRLIKPGQCALRFNLVPGIKTNGAPDVVAPDLRAFLADREDAEFVMGEIDGRWSVVRDPAKSWPFVYVRIRAMRRDGLEVDIPYRFDCSGYRCDAPTGGPWDDVAECVLPESRWPKGSPNSGLSSVIRRDWNEGKALYHPMDRAALAAHPEWKAGHAGHAWTRDRKFIDLLCLLHALLNSRELASV